MEKMKKGAKPGVKKRKAVMAFGTFDLLHLGHVHYLRKAKGSGNYLVVVVSTDQNAEREKGRKPVHSAGERAEMLSNLKFVDRVVVGEREPERMLEPLKRLKPDVVALGYDHPISVRKLKEKLAGFGLKPKIVRIGSYKEKINKSSRIRGKLIGN